MTVSKLSLNTDSDLFNYLAVNEVGSPAKEELNLFLWLLCQEVCGYVYGRLDLRSLHPKSPSHVDPADPVFWVPADVCLGVRKPTYAGRHVLIETSCKLVVFGSKSSV